MTKLPSVDPHVATWQVDRGRFRQVVGWILLVLALLGMIGSQLPLPAGAAPRTASEGEDALAAAVVLAGLAGWALWRRTLTIDRKGRELRIRRGVGPLGWTNAQPLAGIEQVSISRHHRPGRRGRESTEYRVKATGAGKAIRLASFHESGTLASPNKATAFADDVAAFMDWRRDLDPAAPR